jgi:hypothetical protein
MSEDAEREQAEAVALAHMMGYADAEAAVRAKVERLEARIAELEATATGPERDLADLERLAREYGETVRLGDLSIMPGWNPLRYFHPALGGRDCGGEGTRAEALALLKGAKE